MARILITGATGFIGNNLAIALKTDGHDVFYTSLLGEQRLEFINGKRYEIQGTIDVFSLSEFLLENKIIGVVHCASFVQPNQHAPSDVSSLINSNILFGSIVLESAVQSGVKWFVNTGTYWQHYNEKKYSPVNFYAATKQAFEDIAKYYIELGLIKFVTVKLFDTYGPGDKRKKIFNIWKDYAESGELLEMSPGEQLIDISYIDDITNAYSILVNKLNNDSSAINNGDCYYVKAAERYNLQQLSKIFEEVSGKKLRINWGHREYKKREVMVPFNKGTVIPGWKPKISIEDGLRLFLSENE